MVSIAYQVNLYQLSSEKSEFKLVNVLCGSLMCVIEGFRFNILFTITIGLLLLHFAFNSVLTLHLALRFSSNDRPILITLHEL